MKKNPIKSYICFSGYDTVDLTTFLSEESVVHETTEAISNWDFSLYLDLSGDASLPVGAKMIFSVSAFALDNEQSTEQHVYVTVNTPPTTGDIQVSHLVIVPTFSLNCKDRYMQSPCYEKYSDIKHCVHATKL